LTGGEERGEKGKGGVVLMVLGNPWAIEQCEIVWYKLFFLKAVSNFPSANFRKNVSFVVIVHSRSSGRLTFEKCIVWYFIFCKKLAL